MKQFFMIALAGCITSSFAFAGAQNVVHDDDITGFRVGGIVDFEGDKDGDPILGATIGIGEAVYPLDEMIFSYYHMSSDNIDQNGLTLCIEERYTRFDIFRPYARAGVGYLWVDDDAGENPDGAFFEAGGGILFSLGSTSRLYAEVVGQWSGTELWLDNEQFEGNNVQFTAGYRIYY